MESLRAPSVGVCTACGSALRLFADSTGVGVGKFKERAALAQAHRVAHAAVEERDIGQALDLALGFTTAQRRGVANTVPPTVLRLGGLLRRSSRLATQKRCATSCSRRASSHSGSTKPALLPHLRFTNCW